MPEANKKRIYFLITYKREGKTLEKYFDSARAADIFYYQEIDPVQQEAAMFVGFGWNGDIQQLLEA